MWEPTIKLKEVKPKTGWVKAKLIEAEDKVSMSGRKYCMAKFNVKGLEPIFLNFFDSKPGDTYGTKQHLDQVKTDFYHAFNLTCPFEKLGYTLRHSSKIKTFVSVNLGYNKNVGYIVNGIRR